jgi:lipase chaperone LimK
LIPNTFRRHWRVITVLVVVMLLGLAYLAWPTNRATTADLVSRVIGDGLTKMAATPIKPASQAQPVVLSKEDEKFLSSLREKFAAFVHVKHAQIKLIEQVMAYLMKHYPDDWQDRMYGFLKALFPDMAEALYEKFEQLVRFNSWLGENRETLNNMSSSSRRQALWDARREAFGADAEEIFAGAMRNEQLQDALAGLERAEDLRFDEKLSVFMEAVHEIHGDRAEHFIQNRQTELMNRFVSVPTVQSDLHAMSTEERSAAMRQMRSAMGLDEPALQRWDALDRERDQAWDRGQRYMAERKRIESEYEGEERETQMQALQSQEFGEEAEIVRNEEAAGFYRYDRDRRYGRE